MRPISGLVLLAGLLALQPTHAQVFKCTDADGKTVYSQAPCAKADSKEKVVHLMDAPIGDVAQPKTMGSDSTGAYPRANVATETPAKTNPTWPSPYDRLRKTSAASAPAVPSNQQLIAECEANHGARCSSAAEINYRRQEKRTPTAQEKAQIQAAINARREREEAQRERAFFRR